MLLALGCKNTFAALVPAQAARAPGTEGEALPGWQRHGKPACLLALTLLVPLGHFVYFKLNWQAGQYVTQPITLGHALAFVHALGGAIGLDFVGVGLGLVGFALLGKSAREKCQPPEKQ